MSQPNEVVSTSFLDLLTCGFAAVFLLFLISMLDAAASHDEARTRQQARGRTSSPCALIIRASDPATLRGARLIPGWSSRSGREPVQTASGADYLAVYGVQAWSKDTVWKLDRVPLNATVVIDAFSDGRHQQRTVAITENSPLTVWPCKGRP
jgi:hypothetical protein